jgi:hypothetical protein
MTAPTWPCRYCGGSHLESTTECPALAFDAARFIAASRTLLPTHEDRARLKRARVAVAREAKP